MDDFVGWLLAIGLTLGAALWVRRLVGLGRREPMTLLVTRDGVHVERLTVVRR